MILRVFSIFDTRIKEFDAPVLNVMTAEDYYNQVRNAIIIGQIELSKVAHRELYCLGEFDNKSGLIKLNSEPIKVGDFEDLIPQEAKA